VLALAHLLGFSSSLDALMSTRTSQGAIAWIVSLNTVPLAAVPAYWVFGRSKFQGYVTLRQEIHETYREAAEAVMDELAPFVVEPTEPGSPALVGSRLAEIPYLRGNAVELLVDGEATFDSILAGVAAAEDYVLVQFYIVRDDGLGRRLRDALVERARAGVRVWFLYDEIGSHGLPASYRAELEQAGARVSPFHSTRGSGNRFQLNFRNHRKIVVVDGHAGWVGGLNVGDEYLGLDPEFPGWRDTHLRVEGPAVLGLQLSFLEDWRWARDVILDLPWEPRAAADGSDAVVLALPSGPADPLETASLMYQQAIHAARERVWIASPYFVPDEGILSALHLAALRGVDVRVVIPDQPDSELVRFAAYAFVDELLASGVRILRYEAGFMHQKVFLVDDRLAGVGTANFDNRSFRLNFEVSALVSDAGFVDEVASMLAADMEHSREMSLEGVRAKPGWFHALARASFLAAPIL